MAFCGNCGGQLPDGAYACPQCGNVVGTEPTQGTYSTPQPVQPINQQPVQPAANDSGSIGWGVLGFLIPLVGLILFLVWKNTKPQSAKVAGMGALISVVIGIVLNIISAVVAGGASM